MAQEEMQIPLFCHIDEEGKPLPTMSFTVPTMFPSANG